MNDWQGFSPLNDFTGPLLDNLKRHPKRIVFPEGEDVRVLRVSQRFVEEQAGAPILLGRREVITQNGGNERNFPEDSSVSLNRKKARIFRCSATVMNGRSRCSATGCL